jgi:hypothetical protein
MRRAARHLNLLIWIGLALFGAVFACHALAAGHQALTWLGAAPLIGMAVTANQVIAGRDMGGLRPGPVAAGVTLYEGTMVFIERTSGSDEGYLTDTSDEGNNDFFGIALKEYDNSAGANGAIDAECYTQGTFDLTGADFVQGHVGDLCYATDNFTATATAASASRVGRIEEYISATKVGVRLDPVA